MPDRQTADGCHTTGTTSGGPENPQLRELTGREGGCRTEEEMNVIIRPSDS